MVPIVRRCFQASVKRGMRVAERRRLRSSVAPPTEIPFSHRGDAASGDLWLPLCRVVSVRSRRGMRVAERNRLPVPTRRPV